MGAHARVRLRACAPAWAHGPHRRWRRGAHRKPRHRALVPAGAAARWSPGLPGPQGRQRRAGRGRQGRHSVPAAAACALHACSAAARAVASRWQGADTRAACSPMPTAARAQVLDEPAALQSDAGVLALQLRQLARAPPHAALDVVGRLEHGTDQSKRAKAIDAWIASVAGARHERALPRGRAAAGAAGGLHAGALRVRVRQSVPAHATHHAHRRAQEEAAGDRALHNAAARHRGAHAGAPWPGARAAVQYRVTCAPPPPCSSVPMAF